MSHAAQETGRSLFFFSSCVFKLNNFQFIAELPSSNYALHFTGAKVKVLFAAFPCQTTCFDFSSFMEFFSLTSGFPGSDAHSEPSPADVAELSATPPRILQFHHPIQFIAIPDTPGYPIVQTLSISPSVIGLPIPNAAAPPTFILGG